MEDDFKKKDTKFLSDDDWEGFLGVHRSGFYHTKAGASSLYSEVAFLSETSEAHRNEPPDYVLSYCLQKDLETSVQVCLLKLHETKYLPSNTSIINAYGWKPEGEREGVRVSGWEDYEIISATGEQLYTPEMMEAARNAGEFPFSTALWLIVKDICEAGDFLSEDWYFARIAYEYFREYPVPLDNAFLIGELWKELCTKQMFEGDLRDYYQGLLKAQSGRKAGATSTKKKGRRIAGVLRWAICGNGKFAGSKINAGTA